MTGKRGELFSEGARGCSEVGMALIRLNGKVPVDERWDQTPPRQPGAAAGEWSHWGDRGLNMGVNLGNSQPPLAVVEPDSEQAKAKALELFGGVLPPAPIVQSGGKSLHFYFLDGGQGNAGRDQLELRAGVQQCVLPPSMHPDTGRQYEWLPGHAPWDVPFGPLPASVIAYFAADGKQGRAAPIGDEIHAGDRHRTLLSIAGSMRHRGLGEAEILAALKVTNDTRCKPPLDERELARLAGDVVRRYPPAPPDPDKRELRRQADEFLREFLAGDVKPTSGSARTRRRPSAPMIVSLVEFLGGSDDDANWLVDHLAARGALVVVAGLPKVGKSTFVYGLLGALTDV